MEVFGFLVVVGIVLTPFILSIVAISQAAKARRDVEELSARIRALTRADQPAPARAESTPVPPSAPPKPIEVPLAVPAAAPLAPAAPKPPPIPEPAAKAPQSLEVTLGAKAASFVGITAVVVAIVFFVGYAIQHNWIGPAARITMGLAAGVALVAFGHALSRRSERHRVLARALTGGGSALFYFSVFAAYGVYHLIGGWVAGVGLAASAGAVLALSLLYDSLAVALLGVLGAFITPLLISADFGHGPFPLIYVAVVNIPVIALGVRRDWTVLCNLAFAFTVFYVALWFDGELPAGWRTGLQFSIIYYLQFAALSFLQIGHKRTAAGQMLDRLRLMAAASLFGVALYYVLGEGGHDAWRGTAFALSAVIHIVVTLLARACMGTLKDEALTFAVITVGFAGFALPVQLDGPWVSLGWAIEGVALAWLALRAKSSSLQMMAVLLGLLGPFKSLTFDATLFDAVPEPFFNSRFAVGILSATLLGVQALFHGRNKAEDTGELKMFEMIALFALVGVIAAAFADAYWTMPASLPWPGLWTSAVLLMVGVTAAAMGATSRVLGQFGLWLLIAVSVKLLLVDSELGVNHRYDVTDPFMNSIFWLRFMLPVAAAAWFSRRGAAPGATVLNAVSLGTVIALITMEIQRVNTAWADSAITIFWAASGMAMTACGLVRRQRWLRYMGLGLFGVTVLKVFFVDMSGLHGLQRIAAFMGVGLLLLLLSYVYQRVAPILLSRNGDDSGHAA